MVTRKLSVKRLVSLMTVMCFFVSTTVVAPVGANEIAISAPTKITFVDYTNPSVPAKLTVKGVDVDVDNYVLALDYGDKLEFSVDVPDKATVKIIDLKTGDVVYVQTVFGLSNISIEQQIRAYILLITRSKL